MEGCKNPVAVNYESGADIEDFSCLYLFKHNDNCHLFRDVLPAQTVDKSFTMSYSVRGDSWVFFHDYIPDFYIPLRKNLYSLNSNQVFKHHDGVAGQYYDTVVKPFFIDIIFNTTNDLILESVQWVSEYLTSNTQQPFNTLTHIAIWNATQHTGRIPVTRLDRNTTGEWSFNSFRDILKDNAGGVFLHNIFNDYAVDNDMIDSTLSWYDKKLLKDKWFCVRFEFDNSIDATLLLSKVNIQAIKSDR